MSDVFIPLEEGNRWEADIDDDLYSGTAVAEVTSRNKVSLMLTLRSDFVDTVEEGTMQVSKQSDGYLLESLTSPLGDYPDGEESKVAFLKFPAEDGDTYRYTDADGVTYEVTVSLITRVSVSAGVYEDCIRYTIQDVRLPESTPVIFTVKPGVGPLGLSGVGVVDDFEITSTNVDE